MGKPIIRILYFQRRGIDANGYYRLNYIIQRGRKILYYATETKDFEYSDCFTSSCLAERKETILDTAQYIFKVHKVRYSRLILSPSYSYITRYETPGTHRPNDVWFTKSGGGADLPDTGFIPSDIWVAWT